LRILLFGKTGQIGSRLAQTLTSLGDVVALNSSEADFRSPDSVIGAVREQRPSLIVNAAAYTAVDDAERDTEAAALINGTIPGLLAREAQRAGAALVHYSTDYVFDGTKRGAYREDDAPAPVNEYGRSKLAGEQAVRESGAVHLILRTSWIYAAAGKNFVLTVLRLAQTQPELRIVADQIGCPTSADVVAEVTAQAVSAALRKTPGATAEQALRSLSGTYHVACEGSASWCEFAREIVTRAERLGLISHAPQVRAIITEEFPRPARRPLNSVLATGKFQTTFVVRLPSWQTALDRVMAELAMRRNRT
jgi:dTDP-4-dehydrorhamnose reductase